MRDIELYRALLGLTAPRTVAGVDVDMPGQRVVVRVDAGAGPYPCPECGTPGPRYDSKSRRWRHLDTMQFTTWIEAEVPRVECATHGVTIVPDLDRPRLLYLADERKQASLDGFWPTLTPAQRELAYLTASVVNSCHY